MTTPAIPQPSALDEIVQRIKRGWAVLALQRSPVVRAHNAMFGGGSVNISEGAGGFRFTGAEQAGGARGNPPSSFHPVDVRLAGKVEPKGWENDPGPRTSVEEYGPSGVGSIAILGPIAASTGNAMRPGPGGGMMDPQFVIAHELGHGLALRLPEVRRQIANQFTHTKPEATQAARRRAGREDIDQNFAQAYANALTFLLREADLKGITNRDRGYVQALITRQDREVPGTAVFIRFMLKKPYFRGHPFNQALKEKP